ncbi:hypothetical protein ACIQLK_13925 [Microbacterium sp. NPDC091382]|uniref:hypothetical protein n=1 Tax=Microbacterium sp. NPDC091382 TaxID=3364210 RepID=UPI0037FD3C8C
MTRSKPLDVYDDNGALDPVKVVLHSRRASEQAAVIARVRPTWADLSVAVGALRSDANTHLFEGADDRQFAPRRLLAWAPGSRAQRDHDDQVGKHLNNRNRLLIDLLEDYLVATSDHTWALTVLLASNPPFRPLLAAGRILLDAGAHIRYLLDESATLDERTGRAANVELLAIHEELKDDTAAPDRDVEVLTERRAEILKQGDADDLPRGRFKSGEPQPWFAPALLQMPQMADLVLGKDYGRQIWRLASSVVHAQDRTVLRFVAGRGDVDLSGPGLGHTMSVPFVGSCLAVMAESYRDVATYIGRASAELDELVNQVFWTTEAMTGHHDEELLDRAGVDRTGWV